MNLEGLSTAAASVIRDLYTRPAHIGVDNLLHTLDQTTRISPEQGRLFFEMARKCNRTLEVGLAYGFSTVWIMAASPDHTAIDPFQFSVWHGIGFSLASKLGKLRLMEQPSVLALPALLQEGKVYDLIYIDGNHRFDDVMFDFYVSDQLCSIGGTIILDDLWLPSIRRVSEFIIKNRAYQTSVSGDVLIAVKSHEDARNWDHFVEFGNPPTAEEIDRMTLRASPRRDRNSPGR